MFALEKIRCKLAHVNPRSEKNGKDNKLACDLKFEITGTNDMLDTFADGLKAALYRSQVVDPHPGHAPNLRFPFLSGLTWSKEFAGYELTVAHGIGDDSAIVIDGCIVNGFKFDTQEGGTVIVDVRVQCHPDAETIGMLCEKIQTEVEISLQPPESGGDLVATPPPAKSDGVGSRDADKPAEQTQ